VAGVRAADASIIAQHFQCWVPINELDCEPVRATDTEPRAVATGCYHSIHPIAGLLSIRLSWLELSWLELSIPSLSLGVLYHSVVRFTDFGFVLGRDPTDESVGYYHSSASRTH